MILLAPETLAKKINGVCFDPPTTSAIQLRINQGATALMLDNLLPGPLCVGMFLEAAFLHVYFSERQRFYERCRPHTWRRTAKPQSINTEI
jgi:hypothetical protein